MMEMLNMQLWRTDKGRSRCTTEHSENRMYDYLSKWQDAYICKKIESKLVDTQEEIGRILEDYARWKSKFPKSIENSKDLKENQKQKLKKKIEELQSEYERLH